MSLYPNLYILLVGGPGIGKTDAIRNVFHFWDYLPDIHVAPSSVSRASLADALNAAERNILRPQDGTFTKFNSLNAAVAEFGTFITAYEGEFMSTLNDLWDCLKYTERKRHMKVGIDIPHSQLNLIAGTTPAWLGSSLPEHAWREGFSSRLILVVSGERILVDPWATTVRNAVLEGELKHDLQQVHTMYGEFSVETEVKETFSRWYFAGCPPIPEHPKLEHYIPRRDTHFLKILMCFSAARSSERILRMCDYQDAMNLFIETETLMPDLFKSMRTSSDANLMDEVFAFVWGVWARDHKPVPEFRILSFIAQRAPSFSVHKILDVMVSSHVLAIAEIASVGGRPSYKPLPRTDHRS